MAERRTLGRHRPRATVCASGDGAAPKNDPLAPDGLISRNYIRKTLLITEFFSSKFSGAALLAVRVKTLRARRRIPLSPTSRDVPSSWPNSRGDLLQWCSDCAVEVPDSCTTPSSLTRGPDDDR
jgi:hypothetical protein